MAKQSISSRMDEEIIGEIERSAQKRGVPKSEILEKAAAHWLAQDVELTAIERAEAKKVIINQALDRVSSILYIECKGDLVSKTTTLIAVCSGFSVTFPLRENTKLAELSLFEVLQDIQDYDKGIFAEILPILKRFKKIYSKFTQTVL